MPASGAVWCAARARRSSPARRASRLAYDGRGGPTMTPAILLVSLLAAAPPFTATEMMRLQRLSDPQLSPDGRWVAYQAIQIDTTGWTRKTDVWVAPTAGGPPRRITDDPRAERAR